MSRYIDAILFERAVSDLRNKEREEYDNLVGKHRSLARSIHSQHVEFCNKMLDIIRKQPTVDAAPVVRCRECKYFVKNTWECVRLSDRFGDEYSDARVYPEYYCADGERRTGMRYVYVVMYAFKENGGITFGYSNVDMPKEIGHYKDLEQIADIISKGNSVDKGTKVMILNYVLLRKEEL